MGKMGNLSQIVPLFSDVSPVYSQFHTLFVHSPSPGTYQSMTAVLDVRSRFFCPESRCWPFLGEKIWNRKRKFHQQGGK